MVWTNFGIYLNGQELSEPISIYIKMLTMWPNKYPNIIGGPRFEWTIFFYYIFRWPIFHWSNNQIHLDALYLATNNILKYLDGRKTTNMNMFIICRPFYWNIELEYSNISAHHYRTHKSYIPLHQDTTSPPSTTLLLTFSCHPLSIHLTSFPASVNDLVT